MIKKIKSVLRNKYLPAFILIIAGLLAPISLLAQVYQKNYQYGFEYQRLMADSAFTVPTWTGRSPVNRDSFGLIFINPVDSNLLFHNGKKLIELSKVTDTVALHAQIYARWDSTTIKALGYLLPQDSVSLSNRINTKLAITDTTGHWAPLGAYIHPGDTVTMLSGYTRKGDTSSIANYWLSRSLLNADNGVAPLDAGGKVPFANLPASLMIYKGLWNPINNSPWLTDSSGTTGWVYIASFTGDSATRNLGHGNITFYNGDYLIYNGTKWQRSAGTNNVLSVNNQQGIVNLTTTNIPEGSYLYFTTPRAQSAISLTTSGTSGAATYSGGVINVPQYQAAGSYAPTFTVTAPITYSSNVIGITQSTTSGNGYLSSTDWNTFNGKQPAGSYITALTGDGTASGPGSAAFTLANTGVTAGGFTRGIVNAKGLITSATDTAYQVQGSYALTNGSNATGTWPISITGTASSLSAILSSTLGGSGVNNSGTLTWGSGGTLGTAAYTSSSAYAPAGTYVNTFNSRSGAVTLSSGDVTGALGYTPYNPASYPVNAGGETLQSVTDRGSSTSNLIRVTGVSGPISGGPGMELLYSGGEGVLQGYDRVSSKYIPLVISGGNTGTNYSSLYIDNRGYYFNNKTGVTQASIDSVGNGSFNGNVSSSSFSTIVSVKAGLSISGNNTSNALDDIGITRSGAPSYTIGEGPGIELINSTDLTQSFLQMTSGATMIFSYTPRLSWVERLRIDTLGDIQAMNSGYFTGAKFITSGGTSSQFVKGDGSLDGTSYQIAGSYAPSTGGSGYIQNTTTQQASANFNIAGFGQIRDSLVVGTPIDKGNMFKMSNDTFHTFMIGNQMPQVPGAPYYNYFGTVLSNDHGVLITADTNTSKYGYGAQGMLIINGRGWNSTPAHGSLAEIGIRAGDSIGDREMEMTVGYDMGEVTTDNGYSITRWYGTASSQGPSQEIALMGDSTAFTYGFRNYTNGMIWNPYRTDNYFLHLVTGSILLDAGNISTQGILTAFSVQTANYTVLTSDRTVVDNAAGAITFTLPTAAAAHNQEFVFANRSSGALTLSIAVNALAGGTTTTVAAHTSMTIQSDGTNYWQTK